MKFMYIPKKNLGLGVYIQHEYGSELSKLQQMGSIAFWRDIGSIFKNLRQMYLVEAIVLSFYKSTYKNDKIYQLPTFYFNHKT